MGLQRPALRKTLTALVTFVRSFARVRKQMLFQRAIQHKTFFAQRTLQRPQSFVQQFVAFEAAQRLDLFTAQIANVLFAPVFVFPMIVMLQTAFLGEFFAAVFARKLFYVVAVLVGAQMSGKGRFVHAGASAHETDQSFSVSVVFFVVVRLKFLFGDKAAVAILASSHKQIRVSVHMIQETVFGFEHFGTLIAMKLTALFVHRLDVIFYFLCSFESSLTHWTLVRPILPMANHVFLHKTVVTE